MKLFEGWSSRSDDSIKSPCRLPDFSRQNPITRWWGAHLKVRGIQVELISRVSTMRGLITLLTTYMTTHEPPSKVLQDGYQKCVRKYLHGARCRLQEASVLKLRRMRQQETLYSFARFIVAFIGVALGCKNDERNDLCFIAFRDYMKSITLASSDAIGVEEARKTYVRNFDIATEMCLTWTHRSFRPPAVSMDS